MTLRATALATVIALTAAPAAMAETFAFDPSHTQVRATWNHAGMSNQSVHFRDVAGTLDLDADNIEAATVDVTINLASIDTGVAALNDHMKSGDLFDVDNFTTATFKSTGVEQTGDETAIVSGDLTIKGITKPITLDVTLHNIGDHPLGAYMEWFEGPWVGLDATGTIKRSEWGLDLFVGPVSDEITLYISTEMKGQ